MNTELNAYIRSLIPQNFVDGRKALAEGKKIGQSIEIEKSKFLDTYGYDNYLEYRKALCKQGSVNWQLLVGLPTLEAEIDAIKKVSEFSDRTGMNLRTVQSIPSMYVGLPEDYWKDGSMTTSYMMKKPQDWTDHANAAPMTIVWQDWHLSSPNNLETTINAIKAGSPRVGTFSQLIWEYPGYYEEEKRFSNMVRSLGIIASKRDDFITADSYPEDGLPGYFLDVASYVGYMLLEHYIIETLCGAKMSISYGGLLTEIQPRMAFALAMHRLLGSEKEPIISYYNGGTLEQWDHHINGNFGTGVQEMLMEILFEKKYNVMAAISPVSVTERLRVPTLEELLDIVAAGKRAEEKADEWFPLMDFTVIEKLSDQLIEKGTQFFDNILKVFKEAGVDIEDPLQMIMILKRFNACKFEESFHPSIEEKGVFTPYCPSVLGRQTVDLKDHIVRDLKKKGYTNLNGQKIVAVSADGHSYGLMLVDGVLSELGAAVVNGGVDMEPQTVLDLADEEGVDVIAISAHIGQGLDYSKQIIQLAESRNKKYHFFMGGKLNALFSGHTEPIDVTELINETGVTGTNDLEEIVKFIADR